MRREAEAIATIERWKQSGKSKLAFAREAGISITTFHRWFKFYRERAADASPQRPVFVELGQPPVAEQHVPVTTGSPRMRVDLPDGTSIIVY